MKAMANYYLKKIDEKTADPYERIFLDMFRKKDMTHVDILIKGFPLATPRENMQTFDENPLGIEYVLFSNTGDIAYLQTKDGSVYRAMRRGGEVGVPRVTVDFLTNTIDIPRPKRQSE
jgi:hypothetical protein